MHIIFYAGNLWVYAMISHGLSIFQQLWEVCSCPFDFLHYLCKDWLQRILRMGDRMNLYIIFLIHAINITTT